MTFPSSCAREDIHSHPRMYHGYAELAFTTSLPHSKAITNARHYQRAGHQSQQWEVQTGAQYFFRRSEVPLNKPDASPGAKIDQGSAGASIPVPRAAWQHVLGFSLLRARSNSVQVVGENYLESWASRAHGKGEVRSLGGCLAAAWRVTWRRASNRRRDRQRHHRRRAPPLTETTVAQRASGTRLAARASLPLAARMGWRDQDDQDRQDAHKPIPKHRLAALGGDLGSSGYVMRLLCQQPRALLASW
ncbi:hypothetical protein B0J13DRAFT_36489 [Dactylonectria estremocensis]|uniref:Uncharacterized protein n=1 Tax=Dactylonectria estremocensis TaxID=1079267 RepID=A0A9P9FK95_9HYPO|nr:hypothetical protein B0J13DRAFT_36489 [Dactylonectria estremocensis]